MSIFGRRSGFQSNEYNSYDEMYDSTANLPAAKVIAACRNYTKLQAIESHLY